MFGKVCLKGEEIKAHIAVFEDRIGRGRKEGERYFYFHLMSTGKEKTPLPVNWLLMTLEW